MRYAMIIVGNDETWAGSAGEALMEQVNAWWDKWNEAGKVVEGGVELQPARTAKTIAAGPDGAPFVTDGPFTELKEVVGGLIILEADDLDEAIGVASGWPAIPAGDRVEVRAVMQR